MDSHTLSTLLILLLGGAVFLRLVAKEKHRREKHLQYRLEEQVRKLKAEKELQEAGAQKAAAEAQARDAAAETGGSEKGAKPAPQLVQSH